MHVPDIVKGPRHFSLDSPRKKAMGWEKGWEKARDHGHVYQIFSGQERIRPSARCSPERAEHEVVDIANSRNLRYFFSSVLFICIGYFSNL